MKLGGYPGMSELGPSSSRLQQSKGAADVGRACDPHRAGGGGGAFRGSCLGDSAADYSSGIRSTGGPCPARAVGSSARGAPSLQADLPTRSGSPRQDGPPGGENHLVAMPNAGRQLSGNSNTATSQSGDAFRTRSLQLPASRGSGLSGSSGVLGGAGGSHGQHAGQAPGRSLNNNNSGTKLLSSTSPPASYLLSPSFGNASPKGPSNADAQRIQELEVQVRELEAQNHELEDKLDHDGQRFLDALLSLESDIEDLRTENQKLAQEKAEVQEQLKLAGSDTELSRKYLKLERERQDVLQQLDEFEREKEEELGSLREELMILTKRLAEQELDFKQRASDMEGVKESLLETMAEEGKELQSRIEKLKEDKESLSIQLAKALARADVEEAEGNPAGGARPMSSHDQAEAASQLRAAKDECEALRDKVAASEGELLLLHSQLDTAQNKLRLSDMQNEVLKGELEGLRRVPQQLPSQQQQQQKQGTGGLAKSAVVPSMSMPKASSTSASAGCGTGGISQAAASLSASGVGSVPGGVWPKRTSPRTGTPSGIGSTSSRLASLTGSRPGMSQAIATGSQNISS